MYLDCPFCGEPVTTIPACNDAHRDCAGVPPRARHPVWCEDRQGTCPTCHTPLHVRVDEEGAELRLADAEDILGLL
jgi:hypothetical protein